MKAGRFFVSALTVFAISAVVGCGKSEKENTTEVVEQGNQKIAAERANRTELAKKGIYVTLSSDTTRAILAKDDFWSRYSESELNQISSRLVGQVSLANGIIELGRHKNVRLTGEAGLKLSAENAAIYRADLLKYKKAKGLK